MIDNRRQVKTLLQQMKDQLPIPVLATDGLVRSMKRQLPELKRQRQLSIKSVVSSAGLGQAAAVYDQTLRPQRFWKPLRSVAPHTIVWR
jgi:hypothetical protein